MSITVIDQPSEYWLMPMPMHKFECGNNPSNADGCQIQLWAWELA